MQYEFIHPYTTHREVFDNEKDALIFMENAIEEFTQNLYTNTCTDEIYAELQIANDFLLSKGFECSCKYIHSILNVDTNENLGRVYYDECNEKWLYVKIKENLVVEYYSQEVINKNYLSVAMDVDTSKVIEIYRWLDNNLNEIPFGDSDYQLNKLTTMAFALGKYDKNNNLLAITYMKSAYKDMPIEKQQMLENWLYKDSIINIKQQTYGYVVHYIENVFKPMTNEEKQEYAKSAGFCIKQFY